MTVEDREPAIEILIVDDDQDFAQSLALLLRPRFQVDIETSGETAVTRMESRHYDACLLDIDLQSEPDGLEVLRLIRMEDPDVPVIMVSRHDSPDTVLMAGRLGATDFFSKGSPVELLAHRIQAAVDHLSSNRRSEALRRAAVHGGADFVGDGEPIAALRRDAEAVAPTSCTVLIAGPSGTGKGVLARWIHENSKRKDGPFVEINCAAVPEGTVESELFGHERGSYTGATAARRGCFELAQDGTLFLDEITEMPRALQPKLLRVLQSGEYSRLGSERVLRSNARILCATNRDITEAVKMGKFREDLYYRINVVRFQIPPLKDHRDDIVPLARHFLKLKATEQGKPIPHLSSAGEMILCSYDWPGNIRELENVIERAIVFCRGPEIGPELLSPISESAGYVGLSWQEARELAARRFERSFLTLALQIQRGSVTKAAEALGVSRQALYKTLDRIGVDPDHLRR